jgi:serine/threonine-protein kinase OSR1/STK39
MAAASSEEAGWPCTADGYELDKQIGQGAFATVWKAFCKDKSTNVAIKVMDLENVTHAFEDIRQEVNVMRLCEHPNVVRCFCSFVHGNELWLVMEFMDKGSCFHVMSVARKKGLSGGMKEVSAAYFNSSNVVPLADF